MPPHHHHHCYGRREDAHIRGQETTTKRHHSETALPLCSPITPKQPTQLQFVEVVVVVATTWGFFVGTVL
ncbi:Hypothetical predicted protein [Olea europaea subsp. europaea]|uniref:Uncharacterized protein n=1 Tax=Olea europaea subsp. europaea TaxID=158383 RepID=A0A8S0PGB9_OLEEU|nr:Hypothetical predicted protein [Olea europaea subsp. europaea]